MHYVLTFRRIVTDSRFEQYYKERNYTFDYISDINELIKEVLENIRIIRKFIFRKHQTHDCAFIFINHTDLIVENRKIRYIDKTKFLIDPYKNKIVEKNITLQDIKNKSKFSKLINY